MSDGYSARLCEELKVNAEEDDANLRSFCVSEICEICVAGSRRICQRCCTTRRRTDGILIRVDLCFHSCKFFYPPEVNPAGFDWLQTCSQKKKSPIKTGICVIWWKKRQFSNQICEAKQNIQMGLLMFSSLCAVRGSAVMTKVQTGKKLYFSTNKEEKWWSY